MSPCRRNGRLKASALDPAMMVLSRSKNAAAPERAGAGVGSCGGSAPDTRASLPDRTRTGGVTGRHQRSALSQKRADVLVKGYDGAVRLCPDAVQLDPPELNQQTAPANPPWR